jgi:hypothetical protein
MRGGGAQRINVAGAWERLGEAGRLASPVSIGILDAGFSVNQDLPSRVRLIPTTANNVPNPWPTSTGGSAPWHGTNVASAAAAVAGNSFGAARPAGALSALSLILVQSPRPTSSPSLGVCWERSWWLPVEAAGVIGVGGRRLRAHPGLRLLRRPAELEEVLPVRSAVVRRTSRKVPGHGRRAHGSLQPELPGRHERRRPAGLEVVPQMRGPLLLRSGEPRSLRRRRGSRRCRQRGVPARGGSVVASLRRPAPVRRPLGGHRARPAPPPGGRGRRRRRRAAR